MGGGRWEEDEFSERRADCDRGGADKSRGERRRGGGVKKGQAEREESSEGTTGERKPREKTEEKTGGEVRMNGEEKTGEEIMGEETKERAKRKRESGIERK